jgi:hypothetical protein
VTTIHKKCSVSKCNMCNKKIPERERRKDEGKRDENMFGAE